MPRSKCIRDIGQYTPKLRLNDITYGAQNLSLPPPVVNLANMGTVSKTRWPCLTKLIQVESVCHKWYIPQLSILSNTLRLQQLGINLLLRFKHFWLCLPSPMCQKICRTGNTWLICIGPLYCGQPPGTCVNSPLDTSRDPNKGHHVSSIHLSKNNRKNIMVVVIIELK